ncbi:hypothetical protein BHF71_07840 [Vulcanibacillus modesticaldus]|uniref:Uncharacterized protein n=1 Tax=Vulcanibacillus modesticaldus TaxID=337097 RepID=A0A1D2YVB2_9BACI|nr:SPOR domain-containing protein [Vulcanibacillus modesticaldus]OEF99664.1 hypothetical protein BHF71_07840 [Vulcanibacillus modesticaldus]
MPNNRNILAAFKSIEEAQKAAEELKQRGFSNIQVDQIGMYPGSQMNDLFNPITGGFKSLADLTLGSFTNKSSEILASVDVSASGMADGSGSYMDINRNILLTVVTDEVKAKEAEQVIKMYNGQF